MQLRIISTLVALYLCFVRGEQYLCKTPSGGPGTCISLHDCSSLLALVRKPQKTHEDMSILRQSACGFQGQTPKVCCPTTDSTAPADSDFCFTPDSQEGKCIGLQSCSHLTSLLSKPNVDIVAFIQSSKCEGPDQKSVCCGGKPPDFNPHKKRVCSSTVAPPDPRSGCCGLDSSTGDRIIGGANAGIDEYPWMALIEYFKGDEIKLLCGGSLISGRYVLTAGHCVVGPILHEGVPRNVRLGEYDTSNDPKQPDCVPANGGGVDCTTGVLVIPIEKIIAHENYIPRHPRRQHDIALIRLTQLAPYTEFIRPICLPQKDVTRLKRSELRFYVAGWGLINATHNSIVKKYVDVPYRNKEECQPAYSIPSRRVALSHGQICAGGEVGKDSCRGDSGGPLMYTNGNTVEVVGVVSFGPRPPCAYKNVPGVYTKVFEYQTWIRKNIMP